MILHYEYCPLCGKKLSLKQAGDDGLIPYCSDCEKMWFDAFPSCVIVITFNEFGEIAMTLQPHLTMKHWVFTSGFITPGETAEAAAIREVKEELGIDAERLESGGSYWYAKGGMLMHAFFVFTHKKDFVLSEEVQEALWVDVHKAAELMGPVRPGCADFFMLLDLCKRHGLCDDETLWPGQELT